jgi:hypothetical protein
MMGKIAPAVALALAGLMGEVDPALAQKDGAGAASVLVDGKLAVPGAAQDSQSVPSLHSPRNAAIDRLPIVAFRLLYLPEAQKREIYQHLHGRSGGLALSPAYAMVGAEIPANIALFDLRPVPEELSARIPALREMAYLAAGPNVLLVSPANNIVIGVISAP